MAITKEIKDFALKVGVNGTEDLLIQDNGVTKRIKASELMDNNIDLSGYYTKDEVNTLLANLDVDIDFSDYYDRASIDSLLASKANAVHTHTITDITDLELPKVPTKTSDLVNDSGFITTIPSEYVTETELLEKDYATETFVVNKIAEAQLAGGDIDLSGYATKDELDAKSDKSHNHDSIYSKLKHIHSAEEVTFLDGQTFQEKLDNGSLQGPKGDTGEVGPQGPKGDKGDTGTTSWNDLQDKPNIPSIEGLATTEYVDREVEKTNAQLSKIFNKTVEINVRDFGAKGDGVTDDSQAIRKAIESLPKSNWKLIFPPGTYVQGDGTNPHYTNANGSYGGDVLIGKPIYFEFNGMSNFAIEGYGATIIAHPENSCIVNNRGFSFIRCTNGEIKGLTYNGNIENRRPWGGDNSGYNEQCGFTTSACSYLTFEDCNAYGCVMDGFFIGADGRTVADYSNHIKMIRCQSLRNYRQGLSVVNAHYGVLEDCVFAETGTIYGTDPKAGVDMEQGYTFYEDRGQKCWSIKRCTFRDNAGHGLALHWGTHFATVDDCKFERNSLGCYSDSEYRTRDNQITNCTFIDASIGLEGGGVLFQKNRCYNTDLSVGGKDLYSLGMTRRNEISDNLFRWDWNLEDETITDKIIKTQRRVIFTTPDIIFTRNTLINPTGRLILYCNKKIHEISHNTITSTKDLSSNCDYFGTLNGVSATILKDNYVSSQYQHYDKSYLNCFLKSTNPTDRLFLLTNSFNIGQNHRMDIRICKTSMIIPGMTIHIRFSKNEHYVVTYIAPNNQTIRKISGETTNPFEITKVYANDDGYSYTTLRPTSDYNTGVFELELEYPRFYPCGEADSFGFTSERGYVAPENESLVFYKPLLGNVKYSSLPTTDEWLIHEGTQIFYKKLPVWFNGSNWIKADGTIV